MTTKSSYSSTHNRFRTFHMLVFTLMVLASTSRTIPANAGMPRVMGPGEIPKDKRMQPLKDLDGYFPFHLPDTIKDWDERAEYIRHRMLVALGLWPMPAKTPLNPVIHGKIDQGV